MVEIILKPRPLMRQVGTVLCVILFGNFFLAAVPAHADSFVNVTLSNITITGNNSCTPAPCSETFNISLRVDTTNYTLVSEYVGDSGVLGNEFFLYLDTFEYYNPVFVFQDNSYNDIGWDASVDQFPATGTFSPTSPRSVGFVCGFLAHPCVDYGLTTVSGGTIQVTAVTTPEPSSLFLLGTAFLCAVGRRLKHRV